MTSKVTAILVDDEFSALKGLQQKLVKNIPEIEIISTFQQPEDAIKYLQHSQPDLVFLDIQMPRITGFELLAKLKKVDFQIIFVTAYNEFAINALESSAVGYILKPVDSEDLTIVVTKAINIIKKKKNIDSQTNLIKLLSKTLVNSNKIVVPTQTGMSFISQKDIFHLEGYEGYTKFHLASGEEIVSSYNLGKFKKKLNPNLFFKCHKSHIIQIDKVSHFINEGYIILENNQRVPISRNNKKIFLELFN
ncbi:MAG: LytTR family DNA-binding domain-containing protein [Flavobacteriaceae bacterium]|nr:LytTR family DNA-binding domain-containing protein [Flavobacteriaceae bacterium]